MKRRSFITKTAIVAGSASIAIPAMSNGVSAASERNIFEWRVYHVSRKPNAEKILVKFFKDALIPFLNKRGGSFYAFTEYSKSEPVKIYALITYANGAAYLDAQSGITKDPEYLEASKSYNSIPASSAVYDRYETFLLESFEKFPSLMKPDETKSLFELRLYESASEDAGNRKIFMFNKDEIPVFLRSGLIPVFFGKVIAGQYMPALLYLLGFNNMEERDAAWGKFSADPDWITMREKPEYADTVSNIQRIFLVPLK